MLRSGVLPFAATDPLGVPRPLDPRNVFGATRRGFAANAMPVPGGCLAYFDSDIYRPYAHEALRQVRQHGGRWDRLAVADDPPRYCFLCDGEPAAISEAFRRFLPPPPAVSIEDLASYFRINHRWASAPQLLDLLGILAEDVPPESFARLCHDHPWIPEFMR
jgi:hypothetical protein